MSHTVRGAAEYTASDQWNSTREVVERFITDWASKTDKTLMWQEKSTINFGVLMNVEGIVELHYVSVNLEK
jgi:hypothetical protein